MSLFSWFGALFESVTPSAGVEINPASGLPLIEGTTLDVTGNEFGCSDTTNLPSPCCDWDPTGGHTGWE